MTTSSADDFTARDVAAVLRLLDETSGTTNVVRDGLRVSIDRRAGPSAKLDAPAPAAADRHAIVRAPTVGRVRWSIDLVAPVRIQAGAVLGRIELGSRVTELAAEWSGTVLCRYCSDGDFVEYGQALLVLERAG